MSKFEFSFSSDVKIILLVCYVDHFAIVNSMLHRCPLFYGINVEIVGQLTNMWFAHFDGVENLFAYFFLNSMKMIRRKMFCHRCPQMQPLENETKFFLRIKKRVCFNYIWLDLLYCEPVCTVCENYLK